MYKWIDAPYTIRQINGQTVQFLEQIPSPESVQINLAQTPFATMAGYLDSTNCQCNCGGANYVAGPGIVISGDTISAVDTSFTNELQRIDTFSIVSGVLRASLLNDGVPFSSVQLPVWNLIAGTGIGVSNSSGQWTITNTGDLSASNEGVLGVGAGGASSSTLLSNTTGANPVTINVAGSLSITESVSANGGSVTITGTDTDAQTLSLVGQTLSISGGNSVTLPVVGISAGTGIGVSSTAGVFTISNTGDLSATNELQTLSVATNTVTLSNSGGSFTIAGGGINTVSTAGTTITVTGTEVDGSTTNELQSYSHSGTTSYTNTLSGGGGSFTLQASGIASISHSTGTVTINATEIDGSTTNELQTLSVATNTVTLSNSGGSFTIAGAGINTVSTAGTTITVTGTEVDGSVSNELQTYSHSGTTTYTNTLSNGGGSWSLTGAGIAVISQTAGAVTVTATEVDGSITNEGILGVGAGGATSSTLLTNTSTGNAVTINAAGILAITETTATNGGSITLTATEVDGSVTNEAQTLSVSGTTSGILSLSTAGGAGGGTAIIAAGTGISVAQSGGTITITNSAPASGTPWLLGGNTLGAANSIGSNDNFNVNIETNNTTRMVVANDGKVTIGATALTTYALNLNGLQGGGGIFIDGGSGLVGPTFLSTRGNGSGSTTYVIDAQHQMISGNVGAFIQNTATTGTGSAIYSAIVNSGATGDAVYYAGVSGGNGWYFGADNSATGDPFRITNGTSLGAISTGLSILSTGFTGVNNLTPTIELEVTGTGAIGMPVGTVAQRPPLTGEAPLLRYCNEGGMFELGDPNKNAWFRLAALTSPTVTVGAAAGTGGTAAVTSGAGSNDCSGSLTITTGTGTASGTLCTVTYFQPYSGTTSTVLLDAGNDLATTQRTRYSCQASNQTQFSIRAVTALDASQTYIIKYYVRNY